MEQCASEEIYSILCQAPSRPLQARENIPPNSQLQRQKRVIGDSPSVDDVLRPSRKNNSKLDFQHIFIENIIFLELV